MSNFEDSSPQITPEDMEHARITMSLLSDASAFAIHLLEEKQPFSLAGYSERANGEMATHIISAQSDEEMFDKAFKALHLEPTVRFVLIGEGKIGRNAAEAKPALFAYYQDPSSDRPVCLFRHYSLTSTGTVETEGLWAFVRAMPTSWL